MVCRIKVSHAAQHPETCDHRQFCVREQRQALICMPKCFIVLQELCLPCSSAASAWLADDFQELRLGYSAVSHLQVDGAGSPGFRSPRRAARVGTRCVGAPSAGGAGPRQPWPAPRRRSEVSLQNPAGGLTSLASRDTIPNLVATILRSSEAFVFDFILFYYFLDFYLLFF